LAYKIQITEFAVTDAQEYSAYLRDELNSKEAAEKWLSGLQIAIHQLADLPKGFAVISEARALGFPYRDFNYHSHRVVFAVDEINQVVVVHRIYHGARRPLRSKDIPG